MSEKALPADYGTRLLAALPAAAFVIDGVGTIKFATPRAAAAVGQAPDAMVGHSVLEFIDAQTAWAYAAAVAMATDYPSVSMGPLRVTFVAPDGEHTADLWATNHLDDPAIEGIVCLLTDETAAMGLAEAISYVANGQDLAKVAHQVAAAMLGQPVNARAAIVLRAGADGDDHGDFELLAPNDLDPALFTHAEPWRLATSTGIRQLYASLEDMPPQLAEVAAAAGFEALWVEPVPLATHDITAHAAIVLWRERPGNPSPNQLNSVHQAAGILSLAIRVAH